MSSGGKFLPVKQEIKGMKIALFIEKGVTTCKFKLSPI
jgi:hypothetical protein